MVRRLVLIATLALVATLPVGRASEGVASADVVKFRPERADHAKQPAVAKASHTSRTSKHKPKRKRASRKRQQAKQRVVKRPMP